MEKDAFLWAGTIAGFVAAVLSIMEKLLDLRQRFRSGEESEEGITRVAPWNRQLPHQRDLRP